MQTRGIPNRSRRETSEEIIDADDSVNNNNLRNEKNEQKILRRKRNARKRRETNIVGNDIPDSLSFSKNDTLRNRRDAPGCITNYNANRQLLIGCVQPNVIEVRPQCNEDGDEGKIKNPH